MTQEDKELILKDLCARLPYNVNINYKGEIYNVLGICHERLILCRPFMSQTLKYCPLVEEVKLFLFPLSSMTDEQKEEYNNLNCWELGCFPHTEDALDYLIANHFDYRGLIPKGLAIDSTNLNIY